MARITWSEVGDRFYEMGIDRGVLFIDSSPGVPWNGLTAIREAPTGGEAKPYYVDGYKYSNLSAAEEFAATLEALSCPLEFYQCDGTALAYSGLFVTQQPRKSFGLAYRTLIGNDVDGSEHGYKLHLVYNALAAPTQRAYSTVNESSSPINLSWNITTRPPLISGFKPTAHFIVDTRHADPLVLAELEDILYGSLTTSARQPTVQELISLFV